MYLTGQYLTEQYLTPRCTQVLPGGYDQQGELSYDPAAILSTKRALPIGFCES